MGKCLGKSLDVIGRGVLGAHRARRAERSLSRRRDAEPTYADSTSVVPTGIVAGMFNAAARHAVIVAVACVALAAI
jgi:hypothetical protein